MGASTISKKDKAAILKKLGIKTLPADHPIYSEGPTITFINRSPFPTIPVRPPHTLEHFLSKHPPGSPPIVFEIWNDGSYNRLCLQGESKYGAAADTYDDSDDDDDRALNSVPRDAAFMFWWDGDLDPSEFGIDVIEGECPGSDYCAAVLYESIEFANAAAERLGVPIKFISMEEDEM